MKHTLCDIELNIETGKYTLDDRFLGKRELDGTNVAVIEDQLKLLMHYRRDGRKPTRHLLDDIKVYKFILKQPDPEAAANAYLTKMQEMRDRYKTISVSKMLAARELGWRVK